MTPSLKGKSHFKNLNCIYCRHFLSPQDTEGNITAGDIHVFYNIRREAWSVFEIIIESIVLFFWLQNAALQSLVYFFKNTFKK